MKRKIVFTTMLAIILLSPAAFSQGVVSQVILPLSSAKLIAEAALDACTSKGFHTSVAVIDRSGNLLIVLRDELAHPGTIEMAQMKAQTAVLFRRSTMEFQERTGEDSSLTPHALCMDVLAPEGYGEIIGGIASSGSSQPMDDECARAGLAKAEELMNSVN